MDRKENVLVVCAHQDDETFGVGGTIAKYIEEGKNIAVIVFSYGEMSHVWLQKRYSVSMRKKEHQEAKKVLGYKTSIVLGIEEGKFEEEKLRVKDEIKRVMKRMKPTKIFTHNINDPHPDHKAVNRIVMDVCHDLDYKGELYMFDVWNVLDFRRITYPMMYVDISSTFKKKLDALACFRSQWSSMVSLLWNVYSNAIIHGITNRTRFAERFFKVK
jgi:LmbE family N-acetylglucosaminyl deacetylase